MNIQTPNGATPSPTSLRKVTLSIVPDEHSEPLKALTGAFIAHCTYYRQRVEDDAQSSHFFGVQNDFVLDPRALVSNTLMDRGWYVKQYRIRIAPIGVDDSNGVLALDSSPKNVQGVTDITVGTSFSFGGNIGMFGNVPTFGLDASKSSSSSRSYRIDDMKMQNEHHDDYAEWTFTTHTPEKVEREDEEDEPGEAYALTVLKTLQFENFQPTVVAAWRVTELPDEIFVIRTTLEVVFERARLIGERWGAFGQFMSGLISPIGAIREHSEAKRKVITEPRSAKQVFDVAIRWQVDES